MTRWTVGRRIAAGYAVVLLLVLVVAGVGASALSDVSATFGSVIAQREEGLINALGAEADLLSANVDVLRFLVIGEPSFVPRYEASYRAGRDRLIDLRDAAAGTPTHASWGDVLTLSAAFREAAAAVVAARSSGQQDEALRLRDEQLQPARERLFEGIDALIVEERVLTQRVTDEGLRSASRAFWVMVTAAGLALLAGIVMAAVLIRGITVPLHEAISSMAAATAEIVASTTQQAAGAAEEATAVQETTTTVDEVKQTSDVSADKARSVAETAQRSVQVSVDGRRAVEESVQGTQVLQERMGEIAQRILTLSEQAQSIGDVIATVNELTEQSNLLAVNAAIEAARAGEAGRGFAVVATEVKALAEQSKQATGRVRDILNEIQRATQSAVMAAEQGVKSAESVVGLAGRSGDAIRQLSDSLTESSQAAQQIVASAQQQAGGMDQIALAMRNIEQASTQNLASTRQVERAAHDLNELARRLRSLVASGDGRPLAVARTGPVAEAES